MEKIAFYAGSFDPFTVGHFRILCEALCNYDKVIIAIGENSSKKHLFSVEDRKKLILSSINDFLTLWMEQGYHDIQYSASEDRAFQRLKTELNCVEVVSYDYLTVDAALAHGATALIRGKRIIGDDADEMHQAMINKQLLSVRNRYLSTDLIPVPQESLTYISSSTFKALCELGEYVAAMAYVAPSVHNAAMLHYLEKEFHKISADGQKTGLSTMWLDISSIYQNRGFHNLSHLAYGLNYYNIYCRLNGEPTDVSRNEFLRAWFYHDAIMIGNTPEEDSIKLYRMHFIDAKGKVEKLIRATKHNDFVVRKTVSEKLINDIDMAILGDKNNYARYCAGLRQELPVDKMTEFVPRRIEFLEHQMNVRTYELPFFEELFRDSARNNMAHELHLLRS